MELVYGNVWINLVFIPKQRAIDLDALHEALLSATTWGEFQAKVSAEVYEEVLKRIAQWHEDVEGTHVPQSTDAFDPDYIPGYADSDWPAFPPAEMLEWIPKEIQEKYGLVNPGSDPLSRPTLDLPIGSAEEIVAAFERSGYLCISDETLVNKACGYGR
jgi:hypothetical protein